LTPSDGLHLYYKYPECEPFIGHKTIGVYDFIDVLTDGAYAVYGNSSGISKIDKKLKKYETFN